MQRFRGGLVFKAHGLLHHSTLGLRVTRKKKKVKVRTRAGRGVAFHRGAHTHSPKGYLAHEKHSPPRTLQWDHAYGPTMVLGGGVVSYEWSTPAPRIGMWRSAIPMSDLARRCRADMAHARQSRPESGFDCQIQDREPFLRPFKWSSTTLKWLLFRWRVEIQTWMQVVCAAQQRISV